MALVLSIAQDITQHPSVFPGKGLRIYVCKIIAGDLAQPIDPDLAPDLSVSLVPGNHEYVVCYFCRTGHENHLPSDIPVSSIDALIFFYSRIARMPGNTRTIDIINLGRSLLRRQSR